MSVDYELEPDVSWTKISGAIKTGKIRGIKIELSKEESSKGMPVYVLTKDKTYLYAYCLKGGTLFKEFGSRWSVINPVMDAISRYFKVKYYADLDEEGWNAHVLRVSNKAHSKKATTKPTKVVSVFDKIFKR